MVNIQLTEDDAILFRFFREHQDTFAILMASGVFGVKGGKIRLNFDPEGTLDCVDLLEVPTYRRGQKQRNFLSTH